MRVMKGRLGMDLSIMGLIFKTDGVPGRLPDNCAPYVIIYTGAQLSGSGAQLSAILVCIVHTSYLRPCACTAAVYYI